MRGVAASLEGTAAVMLALGAERKAARLWGGAHAIRANIGSPLPPNERANHERLLDQARALLGADAFAAAWETGCTRTWERTVNDALEEAE